MIICILTLQKLKDRLLRGDKSNWYNFYREKTAGGAIGLFLYSS